MTDKLKCPFCGAELVQANTTVKKIWHCPNIDCKGHNYFGVDDFWNTIISGKKAQDALNYAIGVLDNLTEIGGVDMEIIKIKKMAGIK